MVSKSSFTPKEIQEFKYGKWRAVIQKVFYVYVCVCVFYKQTYFYISHTLFCFGKAKPHRTHPYKQSCIELRDSRVEELIYPHRITVKILKCHRALKEKPNPPTPKP